MLIVEKVLNYLIKNSKNNITDLKVVALAHELKVLPQQIYRALKLLEKRRFISVKTNPFTDKKDYSKVYIIKKLGDVN